MSHQKQRALVTGGAGFIGSHLCERLTKLGLSVLCIDNLSSGRLDHVSHLLDEPNFSFKKADVSHLDDMRGLLRDVDVVFHLAARVGVKRYVEDPLDVIETNIYGTHNLLEASLEAGVKRLVFASTSEVYGKNPNVPLREDSDRILGPPAIDRWCYSTAKAVDEHLCNAYFRRYRLPVVILRYFNTYGPRQETSEYGGVVSVFISRVLQDKAPLVHGNGNQTRCFTYVADTVNATIRAAEEENAIGETINVGGTCETTVNQLAQTIITLCGKSGRIEKRHIPYEESYGPWYEDIPRRVPDITKAHRILGFQPTIDLENGLKMTIEWYRTCQRTEN
jgi:UDP-glucose 4-epimerase